jgi:hypothetical protein
MTFTTPDIPFEMFGIAFTTSEVPFGMFEVPKSISDMAITG